MPAVALALLLTVARFGREPIVVERVHIAGAGETSIYALPKPPASYRIEAEVPLRDVDFRGAPVGVYISFLAPFEARWDGVPIGSGTALDNVFVLDRAQRAAGLHRLTIDVGAGAEASRVGSYCYGIVIGDARSLLRRPLILSLIALAGLGLFAGCAIYFGVLYAVRGREPGAGGRESERRALRLPAPGPRSPSVLLLALLCAAVSLLVVAETWRWIAGYGIGWHIVRLRLIVALTYAVALLLPLFFIVDLALPRARRWGSAVAAALLLCAAVPRAYDWKCLAMFWCAALSSAAVIAVAAGRSRRRIGAAAGGVAALIVALAATGYDFGDGTFSIAFMLLIVALLASMALQLRDERREAAEAKLRAARLEIELLKKTLQPHFLMNTLTAVIEWIESAPNEGVRFLEALADELRILCQVSSETAIPAARELELCRSHLAIMSCRKGMEFALAARDVDGRAAVPPAIFHTLLENAVTHNAYDHDVTFTISEERDGTTRRYVVETPLGRRGAPRPEQSTGQGTGLRYVQARLEESFPGRWRLDSRAAEGSWLTTIVVPA